MRQYTLADYVITFVSFLGFSIPIFFLGILLLYFFAVVMPENLRLPTGGVPPYLPSDVGSTVSLGEYIVQWVRYLILPVLALSLIQMAAWASLLEVLNQDYVRTARSKGLSERVVIYKHALRNALIPMVTLVGLAIPGVLGGAVITETIFSWPGMGRAIFDALVEKDYNVAMAALALLALLTVLFNLIADLMYAVVDPRIRYN